MVQTVTETVHRVKNWVECTVHPTLSQPARTLRRVAGLGGCVSGLAARIAAHRVAAPAPCRGAFVSRPKVAPLSHDTNLCIATLLPAKRTARRVARAWPYCRPPGRIMAKQRPYRGPLRCVVACPCALPPSLA